MTVLDALRIDWPRTGAKSESDLGPGLRFELIKRIIDLVGAAVGLVCFAPLIFGCALWIKMSTGGPVFYRQTRVGRHGRRFQIWKLRTMGLNAETDGACLATPNDPRVLLGCRWIRKSHLDELPQLLNILRGEMSLVGPRPERPEVILQMRDHLPEFERRLVGVPGLTGLAQVRNGYTNDMAGMRRKLSFDLEYLDRRSIFRDLRLILATLPRFWDRSAC